MVLWSWNCLSCVCLIQAATKERANVLVAGLLLYKQGKKLVDEAVEAVKTRKPQLEEEALMEKSCAAVKDICSFVVHGSLSLLLVVMEAFVVHGIMEAF